MYVILVMCALCICKLCHGYQYYSISVTFNNTIDKPQSLISFKQSSNITQTLQIPQRQNTTVIIKNSVHCSIDAVI